MKEGRLLNTEYSTLSLRQQGADIYFTNYHYRLSLKGIGFWIRQASQLMLRVVGWCLRATKILWDENSQKLEKAERVHMLMVDKKQLCKQSFIM